jgi:23S rRNA (guanosine2251-2'-O)-methyltransferase
MLTECPNPLCKLTFEVPDERAGKNGPCPQCGQVITFRSLEIIRGIERQHELTRQRQAALPADPSAPAPFSALLEDIRSLWNVGSIFRSADGAGFTRLYLSGITGCPPNKSIAKTSLGAEDHIGWEHCNHALDILPGLKAAGVKIVALEKSESSVPLQNAIQANVFAVPLCMVIGNEVAGVSVEALALADVVVHLPMRGIKTSLNVAVAFGIAAYEIRQALPDDRA